MTELEKASCNGARPMAGRHMGDDVDRSDEVRAAPDVRAVHRRLRRGVAVDPGVRRVRTGAGTHRVPDHRWRRGRQRDRLHRHAHRGRRRGVGEPDHRRDPDLPHPDVAAHHPRRPLRTRVLATPGATPTAVRGRRLVHADLEEQAPLAFHPLDVSRSLGAVGGGLSVWRGGLR